MREAKDAVQKVQNVKTIPLGISKIVNITAALLLVWMIVVLFAPLFINGNIYHINSPAPIEQHGEATLRVTITRKAVFDMSGTCSYELQCNNVIYEYGNWGCPIEKGTDIFTRTIELPPNIVTHVDKGHEFVCEVHGIVEYAPVGILGPQLKHSWFTEEITLE